MKRKLLVLATLLSLCVLLAACKKSDDTISTSAVHGNILCRAGGYPGADPAALRSQRADRRAQGC